MMLHTIEVQIDELYGQRVTPESLRRAALTTLAHQQIGGPCELTIVVTSDEALRELSRRHRGVDVPTDVLAFSGEAHEPFVGAPGLPRYLGDVIISFPRAEAQATEAENEVQAELQLLVVHGVLHLLGYDDQAKLERARMWKAQQTILDGLGVEVHLPD
jgi:probable rRNA maturation factor